MSSVSSHLAAGAGESEPAGLPGSSGMIARTLPAEYLVKPKVQDCRRHQHFATGGLGFSSPYSSHTPQCNGCAVGKKEDEEREMYRTYIINCERDLRAAQERYALKDDPSVGYTDEKIAEIEFTIQTLEWAIEEHYRALEELEDPYGLEKVKFPIT